MMPAILRIAGKEIRESARDRRSLASGLLYGLWGPLVMVMAVAAIARARATETTVVVPAAGLEKAPALERFLSERGVAPLEAAAAPGEAIRRREIRVGLVIDERFGLDFEASRPGRVTLIYDSSWPASKASADRVRAVLGEYRRQVGATRLVLRGVAPAVASPIDLQENDLSTAAGRAAAAVGTLPIFVLLAAFLGGMSVAADATAGERERASLESLLLYPVPRVALAAGKWMAAALFAVATVSATVAVSAGLLRHPRVQSIDLPVGLSLNEAFLVWALILPLAFLAPAIQISIGLFSRSFKEANTNLSLLIFVPMLPGFLFAFGSLQPQFWMTMTPVLGQQVSISAVLRGEPLDASAVAVLSVVCLAATALAIVLAARMLDREALVRGGTA